MATARAVGGDWLLIYKGRNGERRTRRLGPVVSWPYWQAVRLAAELERLELQWTTAERVGA